MARWNEVGKHATTVLTNDKGVTEVVYHDTCVVAFDSDTITLDTGGFKTPTTKVRMNQASNEYDLEYGVYQKDWVWYVEYNGTAREFDGNTAVLDRNEPPHEVDVPID